LNLPSINLRLTAGANPAVSLAAVNQLRESGNAAAVPALQQKLVDDFERDGSLERTKDFARFDHAEISRRTTNRKK
jgi:hypothetical protein